MLRKRRRTAALLPLLLGAMLPVRASAPASMTAADALFGYHNYPGEYALAADALEHADPIRDAGAAFARGDSTLIELCDGYAGCIGPEGVAADDSYPVRIVPRAVGCIVRGREDLRFRDAAHRYAAAYNAAVLALHSGGHGPARTR